MNENIALIILIVFIPLWLYILIYYIADFVRNFKNYMKDKKLKNETKKTN